MRRHLKLLEHALSSVWRRKGKSIAIVVAFSFTVAVLASVLLLTHALRTDARQLLQDVPDVIVQRQVAGRHELISVEHAERIGAITGVARVEPRLWGYYYDALTKANYTLLGVYGQSPSAWPLLEGRMPNGPDECAVGVGVAEVRNIIPGDDLALIDATNLGRIFTVTGVFAPESQLLSNDLVVLTADDLQSFFHFPAGYVTDLAVSVYNPAEIDNIAGKIKRLLPESRPITRSEISRTYDAVFNWRSGMLLTVFLSALAAFCILAWDKATGLSSEERQEIGILKAVGWDTADILLLKFWEGMAVALVSFLVGICLAMIHVFVFDAPLLSAVIKGWSVLFPKFALTPYIDFYQVAILAFLTIAPYVASTVIPSWKAAVTEPDSIMRS